MKHRKIWIFIVVVLAAAIIFGVIKSHEANAPTGSSSPTNSSSESSTLPEKNKPTSFNKRQYSVANPASLWVIANKKHPLNPKSYAPNDLVSTSGGQYMRAEAARALSRMLGDAQAAGYVVTPASGYRSYNTQVSVYSNEVKRYGQAIADSESARPGYSEHQTGLAVDLASGGCSIQDCFGNTPGGKWVTANSYKYGFILRYTPDKVNITGYRSETWHFRYVGIALSTELHKTGVKTLEEFFNISGGNYSN